jgi:hypothetical protein
VPDIARRLGVAKSTAYQWTRHLPLDPTPEHAERRMRRHIDHMRETRWEPFRRERDADRAAVETEAAAWVDQLSDRELILAGAIAYWCEGGKEKPWRKNNCSVQFINSDERLILLFVRFVESLGVDRSQLHYRISIHESADVDAATRWWSGVLGIPVECFHRPTLKKHNPATIRHNVEESYRGCLIIYVPKSRRMYWRIEGVMEGIARSGRVEPCR